MATTLIKLHVRHDIARAIEMHFTEIQSAFERELKGLEVSKVELLVFEPVASTSPVVIEVGFPFTNTYIGPSVRKAWEKTQFIISDDLLLKPEPKIFLTVTGNL